MVMWHIYGYAIPVVILAVLYGLRWKAGMWSNCLSLGAILFSILVAVGGWENLAELIAQQAPSTLFLADCIALWIIFLASFAILDIILRFMSTVKVKYADPVEKAGNGIALFLIFVALYSFFLFAEDLGPVGEHADAAQPEDTMMIQTFRFLSAGNLSGFTKVRQFDDKGNFRKLHLQRRQALMHNVLTKEGSIQFDGNIDQIKRRE
jgi:signal transduction histidine kinase